MTMEKTLKNGKQYSFNEIWRGHITAYCFYDNRWNPLSISFKTWDEVKEWCDEQDRKFENPVEWKPATPPANYYEDTTRYFGD